MRTLSSKEKRAMGERFPELDLDKKSNLQYDEKAGAYYLDRELVLIENGDDLVPYLKSRSIDRDRYPEAVVDMPAVPFMAKGADLLRPGIVHYDAFSNGDIIKVTDERNRVVLAFMRALVDSSELEGMEKGKIAKSLHYVGDEWWSE